MATVNGSPPWGIDLARQRDVAMPGGAEFPVHLEVVHQILPTVAGPDIPNGSPRKPFAATHDQMHPLALGVEQVVAADFRTPTGVARALARDVRGQQRVETQLAAQRLIQHLESGVHEHHRAMRIGQDVLDQPVAPLGL